MARLRTEINADRCQVMVPQTHPPAAEAEVDFGEFAASIAGQAMKLYMFCLRLSHSGKAFHFGYANQTQEWFLDGHVQAFEAFGGVPRAFSGRQTRQQRAPHLHRMRRADHAGRSRPDDTPHLR